MTDQNGKLSQEEIEKRLKNFPEWDYNVESKKLVTSIEFKDFDQMVGFVNLLKGSATNLGHHPDLYLYDSKFMQVLLSTQAVDGITEKDFELAGAIDTLLK